MTSPRANLLLIGNDSNLRGLLIHFLALEGYKFFDADTKSASLSLAGEIQPEVILVDEKLSDCDGLAVCQALKGDEKTRRLPVVLMTATGQSDVRKQASDFGIEEFITKPPEAVEVRARVRNLLRIQSLKERLLQANREMDEEAKKLAPKKGKKAKIETGTDEAEETKEPARAPALRFLIELDAEVGILFPEDTFTPRPMNAKTRDLSATGGYFEVYDFQPELFAKLGQSVRSAKIGFPKVPELSDLNLYGKIVWLNYQKSKMVCALGVSYDHAPEKYHKFLEKQQSTSSWS